MAETGSLNDISSSTSSIFALSEIAPLTARTTDAVDCSGCCLKISVLGPDSQVVTGRCGEDGEVDGLAAFTLRLVGDLSLIHI